MSLTGLGLERQEIIAGLKQVGGEDNTYRIRGGGNKLAFLPDEATASIIERGAIGLGLRSIGPFQRKGDPMGRPRNRNLVHGLRRRRIGEAGYASGYAQRENCGARLRYRLGQALMKSIVGVQLLSVTLLPAGGGQFRALQLLAKANYLPKRKRGRKNNQQAGGAGEKGGSLPGAQRGQPANRSSKPTG